MIYQAIQSMDDYVSTWSHTHDLRQVADSHPFACFPSMVMSMIQFEKLLLNSWSAEYALRITPAVNDKQYLQSSLHWTFPQAYYSILFSARAFLAAKLWPDSNPDVVARRVGRLVAAGYYPQSLSYYTVGAGKRYKVNRLPPDQPLRVHLDYTRDRMLKQEIHRVQCNPKTALRHPTTGAISKTLTIDQLRCIARNLGHTSFFDVMTRLRISSTDRDIERLYQEGEAFDVSLFHDYLLALVEHINSVHELYVLKAVGTEAYSDAVWKLPSYLRESFVNERFLKVLLPALAGVPA
jgi:hypothetical protein